MRTSDPTTLSSLLRISSMLLSFLRFQRPSFKSHTERKRVRASERDGELNLRFKAHTEHEQLAIRDIIMVVESRARKATPSSS
ncbi:hypothetical protein Scep_021455 [Stephania cephalantha]|uniref:Uncharacterized protein n=1 Tax=Stephania cephalantha TaxID=152367 RepID=A0AAP0I1F4_9MAGN